MSLRFQRPFVARADGTIDVNLADNERAVLASLPMQLTELLSTDDASLRRLFPAAYHQDPEHEEEYQRLMRTDLVERRVETAKLLAEQANLPRLVDDAQVTMWLSAINDLRLVLGTQLDVSEDMDDVPDDDPLRTHFEIYSWLGWLMECLIQAAE